MLLTKPKGTYVRSAPDWWRDYLMGTFLSNNGVAGQLTYTGIYNDAKDGTYLVMVGLEINTGLNTGGALEMVQGDQGAAHIASNPLNPLGAIYPGVGVNFTNPTCIGTHIGSIGGYTAYSSFWPYDWPWAIVPPGWTAAWQSTVNQIATNAGFWWYPIQPGTTA